MDVEEFIDTYSDDLIHLHEGRAAILTHPLRVAWKENLDASFCRMLAVFMVGGIEVMLEAWRDRDRVKVLDRYFAKNVQNGARVSSLFQAFRGAGIPVDPEVFDDYLAIKYLRNTIVHGHWKEQEKEWLEKRGFPTDTRKLTKQHFDRIEHVNQNMMFYIFLTSRTMATTTKPANLIRLDEILTRRADETGILRLRDLDKLIWNNLERIDANLYRDVEATAISERYNWARGRSHVEIGQPASHEAKRLFYLAAREAGEEDYQLLVQHRPLAEEALAFWKEYWQRAVVGRGLQEADMTDALAVLESSSIGTVAPLWLAIKQLPDAEACRVIESALGAGAPFTSEEVLRAFREGNLAWQVIPNITPVGLLTLRLPIVDPAHTAFYLGEAQRALDAFRLGWAWYSWVEYGHNAVTDDLNFYRDMQREFAERQHSGVA
jgi:hypothetical protein